MNTATVLAKHRRHLERVLTHQFYRQLTAGRLPVRKLAVYLAQDNLYLDVLAATMKQFSSRGPRKWRSTFDRHHTDTISLIAQQRNFVKTFLNCPAVLEERARPTTYAYGNHLQTSSMRGFVQGLTSLLPCYLFYRHVAQVLHRKGSRNPVLAKWIYGLSGDNINSAWVQDIVEIFDVLARKRRARELEQIFLISASYEILLLDMALRDESWP